MTEELNGGCLDERLDGDLPKAMLQAGMMALLECAASDLESYSPLMFDCYEEDVRRVYSDMRRASLSTSKQAGAEPVGWQVRGIGREDGPGEWRHADAEDVEAYRNGPDMWELRPVFASPGAAIAAREQVEPMPEGWKLVEKKTCYVLLDGDTVVASLAGPESVHYAAILARAIATPPAAIPTAPSTDARIFSVFNACMFRDECRKNAAVASVTQPTTVQQDAERYRAAAEAALRTLEVYMKLPADRWPGPPTTAVLSLRAALKTAPAAVPGDAG